MENARIRALPPEVIGQIAAGEVVERPAAAVKELVENSMDAGAAAITVDIRDGGLTSFRVVDNGRGIDPSDLRMAFERHTTSKIRTVQDLCGVQTLGFRGEALASIAAVAKVTCTTRTKSSEHGMMLQNDGGTITDIREAACPEGTSLLVKDIFFNTPVRRKFMKKPQTEAAYVSDLMMRLILSHPQISFRYMSDGKTIYFSAGDGKLESAIHSIYGTDTLKILKKAEGHAAGLILSGYIGIGDASRGNRTHQSFFLNGRAFRSGLLTAAVEEACRQRMMTGKFPLCILHISMPYELADVNVHPNKWEVRFQNEEAVRDALYNIIADTFQEELPLQNIPPLFLDTPAIPETPPRIKTDTVVKATATEERQISASQPAQISAPFERPSFPAAVLRDSGASVLLPAFVSAVHDQAAVSALETPAPVQATEQAVEQKFAEKKIHILGVVFNTYIVMEIGEEMLLCDQHAVHERILFERMMRNYETGNMAQTLLTPQVIRLTHREYEVFSEYRDAVEAAGFEAEEFGENTVQIRAVPVILGSTQADACLRDALDELESGGHVSSQKRVDRIIQMACKHAVKGGEKLPMDALLELIRQMLKDKVIPTCPHGRPLIVSVTKNELDKRFKRIQS